MDIIDQQIENLEVRNIYMLFTFIYIFGIAVFHKHFKFEKVFNLVTLQHFSAEWRDKKERGNGNTTNNIRRKIRLDFPKNNLFYFIFKCNVMKNSKTISFQGKPFFLFSIQ